VTVNQGEKNDAKQAKHRFLPRTLGRWLVLQQAMDSTLIYGERDAVLVDTFMTVKQADALAMSQTAENAE
jgi:hypothetical protein